MGPLQTSTRDTHYYAGTDEWNARKRMRGRSKERSEGQDCKRARGGSPSRHWAQGARRERREQFEPAAQGDPHAPTRRRIARFLSQLAGRWAIPCDHRPRRSRTRGTASETIGPSLGAAMPARCCDDHWLRVLCSGQLKPEPQVRLCCGAVFMPTFRD
jgi:hypothetical protein